MIQQDSKSASFFPNGCGCLVLLMCIGIMTAIALPSFLAISCKSKQTEGKLYVASMNKGQQAYFAEKSVFGTSVDALGIGIKTETTNYKYSLRATKKAAFSYAVSKRKESKGYAGGVFVVYAKEVDPSGAKYEMQTILCQADDPGTIKPAEPTYENGKIACGQGTTPVTK
jgi:type II secretory pathway pseudopilin PulG